MKIVEEARCFGCGCCADVCPKKCIRMTYDAFGFLIPSVDESVCVQCGKCRERCPALHPVCRNPIREMYKGHRDSFRSEADQKSTSGAAFAAAASCCIAEGGNVVGAAFCDQYRNVEHVVCENMDDVDRCRGSKYIQSQTQGVYARTRALLQENKTVLFSGTPCQIAALKSYLQDDPDNLITVDFICHGVASTAYYRAFLAHKAGSEPITSVAFRAKSAGYTRSNIRVTTAQQVVLDTYFYEEPLFGFAFAQNLISRDSCGTCPFANRERVSDITLADNMLFLDADEAQYGSSFVFVNSPKGKRWLEKVSAHMLLTALDTEQVIPKLAHLHEPARPHSKRGKLLADFQKNGIEHAARYIPKPVTRRNSFLKRLAIRVLDKLYRIVHRM